MPEKNSFLDECKWKETTPSSPFNDWKEFGAMYVWMKNNQNTDQKRIFDPVKDIDKINNILYQVVKTVIFGAKVKGIDGINVPSLRTFVNNRFDFETQKQKAISLLIDWFPHKVKEGANLIFPDYFSYLFHSICEDNQEQLKGELGGKVLTGEYTGKSVSSLTEVSFSNAKITGPINNSTITHIDAKSVIEKIEGPDGIIEKNDGVVWLNDGQIKENLQKVFYNEGNVSENNGVILKNERGGTIGDNSDKGVIEVNLGIVENNSGTIKDNPEGKILLSTGKVTLNSGSLEKNEGKVTLNINTIDENIGTVDGNKGIVRKNRGHIEDNTNTVESNEEEGVIQVNSFGNVRINRAIIRTNESEVFENENTIDLNGGRVRDNKKLIKVNEGMIENNSGSIETNNNKVESNAGTILTNARRVDRNKGTIMQNHSIVITNDGLGVIEDGNEDSVVIMNKGTVQGKGRIIFHDANSSNSNVDNFEGKVLDSDPTSADIFDLL